MQRTPLLVAFFVLSLMTNWLRDSTAPAVTETLDAAVHLIHSHFDHESQLGTALMAQPTPQMELMLPRPMSDREFRIITLALSLSETQIPIAESFYREYQREVDSIRTKYLHDLAERSVQLHALQAAGQHDFSIRFDEMLVMRSAYARSIEEVDAAFMSDLRSVLHEGQADLFERAQLLRGLMRSGRFWSDLPGGGADLIEVTLEARLPRAAQLTVDEWLAHDEAVLQYLRQAIGVIARPRDSRMAALGELNRLIASRSFDASGGRLDEADPGTAEWVSQVRASERARKQRLFADEEAILSLNNQFQDRFREGLPEIAREAFTDRWRRVYPNIYPDLLSAHDVFRELLAHTDLPAAERDVIEEQRRIYEASWQAISTRMERRMIEWRRHLYAKSVSHDDRPSYEAEMRDMYLRRVRTTEGAIVAIEKIAGPERSSTLRMLGSLKSDLERQRAMDFPWRAP